MSQTSQTQDHRTLMKLLLPSQHGSDHLRETVSLEARHIDIDDVVVGDAAVLAELREDVLGVNLPLHRLAVPGIGDVGVERVAGGDGTGS